MKNNNKNAGRLFLEPIKFINKQGFTFIEILTVVFIIGIIALPFTNMFIFGVKGSNQNTDSVIASNLARDKIEDAWHKRTCQSGYTMTESGCLNLNKSTNYIDGYYCTREFARLRNNACIIVEEKDVKRE